MTVKIMMILMMIMTDHFGERDDNKVFVCYTSERGVAIEVYGERTLMKMWMIMMMMMMMKMIIIVIVLVRGMITRSSSTTCHTSEKDVAIEEGSN